LLLPIVATLELAVCYVITSILLITFFFTALSPPEIYTLSLHDALPISCSSSAMIVIVSAFGNPVMEPDGNNVLKILMKSLSGRRSAVTVAVICYIVGYFSVSYRFGTRIVPGLAILAKSCFINWTICSFSLRFFDDRSSHLAWASSSSNVFPRATVPAIGFVIIFLLCS